MRSRMRSSASVGLPLSVAMIATILRSSHTCRSVSSSRRSSSYRVPLRLMLALSLLLQIVSLVMGPRLSGVPMALAYGAILGLTSGLMRTVTGVAWAHYFGRQHLGAIAGLAATIGQAGSALGPMPLGIARDLMGRYDTALLVSAALPLALAVACLVVRAPQRSA